MQVTMARMSTQRYRWRGNAPRRHDGFDSGSRRACVVEEHLAWAGQIVLVMPQLIDTPLKRFGNSSI